MTCQTMKFPHRFLGKTAKGAGWLDPFSSPPNKNVTLAFIERNLGPMIWRVDSLVCAKISLFWCKLWSSKDCISIQAARTARTPKPFCEIVIPKFHTVATGAGQDHFRHDRTMSSARRFPCFYFRMWPYTVPVVVKWCVELPKILVDEYATLEPSLKWPSCVVLFSNFSFFEYIETSLRIRSERIKVNCQGSVLTICDVLHLPYQNSSVLPS